MEFIGGHWGRLESTGLQWNPMESNGVKRSPIKTSYVEPRMSNVLFHASYGIRHMPRIVLNV
eukprot:1032597-Lingulodinium_polyedra.AAC.1